MKLDILSTIRSKIHRLKGTTIIQFGAPRSGTTLVYNILKDIFPKNFVESRHYYREKDKRFPTVVTYRNPLDSRTSSILRDNIAHFRDNSKPTNNELKKQIYHFDCLWTVFEIRNNNNVLMLKYEDFVNNYEIIFNKIEKFFDINISSEVRNLVAERYSINSVEKICSKMKSYWEIDKKTFYHGNHININKGQPNFHLEFLKNHQILHLKKIYKKFIEELNY